MYLYRGHTWVSWLVALVTAKARLRSSGLKQIDILSVFDWIRRAVILLPITTLLILFPTNDIPIEFDIPPKFAMLWFKMYATDQNEILHT